MEISRTWEGLSHVASSTPNVAMFPMQYIHAWNFGGTAGCLLSKLNLSYLNFLES
jgi:hypothetical protein